MASLVLAIYLILVGLAGFVSGIASNLPSWLLPLLALIAGVLFLLERFGMGGKKS